MHKHLKEPLIPPDHINTALSQGVGEVIEVMMAKNRQDRYSNMEEALLDLEAVPGASRRCRPAANSTWRGWSSSNRVLRSTRPQARTGFTAKIR